jgi:Pvc16 N-terminal domain
MATFPAISATSQAILSLLQSAAVGHADFDGIGFAHYQASNFESPMTEGLSLYLYRLTVSSNRNLPPQLGRDGRRYLPPLPLDLHYLLTAWARDPIRQQRLLGFAIRTLENTPILPAGVLNREPPETDVFRAEETVELVFESVSIQDLSYVWNVAQSKEQPSATYVARMVEIESDVTVAEAAEVQTREFDHTFAVES